MAVNKFNLPDVGEGLTEAEIVSWKVKPGDSVGINDVLCEIETAKSIVELPSPFAGTVTELLVPEGLTIDVGTPIISVSDVVAGDPTPADVPAPALRTAEPPAAHLLAESAPDAPMYGRLHAFGRHDWRCPDFQRRDFRRAGGAARRVRPQGRRRQAAPAQKRRAIRSHPSALHGSGGD